MNERMNKEELLRLIQSIGIDKEEFVILSSSALTLRGILKDAGDLDIAVTPKGLEDLNKLYNLKPKGNGWYIVNDKIECVPDSVEKELIEGYYVQDIYNYLSYLEKSERQKDKDRIPLVKKYIDENY